MKNIELTSGDTSKYGLENFYPSAEKKLIELLNSNENVSFEISDTKEILSGNIEIKDNNITISVHSTVDDLVELISEENKNYMNIVEVASMYPNEVTKEKIINKTNNIEVLKSIIESLQTNAMQESSENFNNLFKFLKDINDKEINEILEEY